MTSAFHGVTLSSLHNIFPTSLYLLSLNSQQHCMPLFIHLKCLKLLTAHSTVHCTYIWVDIGGLSCSCRIKLRFPLKTVNNQRFASY